MPCVPVSWCLHSLLGELSARTCSVTHRQRLPDGRTLGGPSPSRAVVEGAAAGRRGPHAAPTRAGEDASLPHAPSPNPGHRTPKETRSLPAARSRPAQRLPASQEETLQPAPDSPRGFSRIPRAHSHGHGSGQGWRTRALHSQAGAPSAPKGAPGGSQLPPVRPALPPAGRRASWHRLLL